jgi:hypothetical protein
VPGWAGHEETIESKKMDRINRIKNRIYRITSHEILNPVNPEKSC